MSRLTRDGTTEPVSRDQILRRERGQGNVHFPRSADHEQDWQPYPAEKSDIRDDHTVLLGTFGNWTTNIKKTRAECVKYEHFFVLTAAVNRLIIICIHSLSTIQYAKSTGF